MDETTTVPSNQSPTNDTVTFNSSMAHIEAIATSMTVLRPEVPTDYKFYTSTVPSAIRVDQQLTTAQYKPVIHSRYVDLESSVNTIPLSLKTSATHVMYTSRVLYNPAVTEQGIIINTDPILATTARKNSQAATTINIIDPQKTSIPPTNSIQASQHVQSATSSVYRLTTTVFDEASESTVSTKQLITDPSLATTTRKSSQAVTLKEAVAWALLSLMTLLFIVTLSVAIILCIQKHRQNRDNTVDRADAPVYEMDGNPCYESLKMDNTHGTNIYEPIETERVQYL
jgi:hypothetical protein